MAGEREVVPRGVVLFFSARGDPAAEDPTFVEIQTVQGRTVRIIMESLVMVEAGQPCFDA